MINYEYNYFETNNHKPIGLYLNTESSITFNYLFNRMTNKLELMFIGYVIPLIAVCRWVTSSYVHEPRSAFAQVEGHTHSRLLGCRCVVRCWYNGYVKSNFLSLLHCFLWISSLVQPNASHIITTCFCIPYLHIRSS